MRRIKLDPRKDINLSELKESLKNMKHGIKLVTLIYLFSIILDSFLLAE